MNDQGLDKLFRDKLEGLEENPPIAAWDRLDDQLQGRKRKAWWLLARVAAVLVIIACSVMVFNKGYLSNHQDAQVSETTDQNPEQNQQASENNTNSNEDLVAENKSSSTESNKEKNHEATQNRASDAGQNDEVPQPQPKKPSNTKTPGNNESQTPIPGKKQSTQIKLMQSPQTQVLADNTQEIENQLDPQTTEQELSGIAQVEPTASATETAEEPSSSQMEAPKRTVKITYKKSPSPPEPTLALVDEPEDKTSAVKRLWQKAQNLKNGQVGLAKIRSAKDQLLVFNKKKKEKEVKSN